VNESARESKDLRLLLGGSYGPKSTTVTLLAMAIAGRILVVLGAGLLLLAGFVFLAALPDGSWGPHGAGFGLFLAKFPGVPGIFALLLGVYLVRQERQLREFNEAMERNNHSLRGVVCDEVGAPIPKATVDVFIEKSQEATRGDDAA